MVSCYSGSSVWCGVVHVMCTPKSPSICFTCAGFNASSELTSEHASLCVSRTGRAFIDRTVLGPRTLKNFKPRAIACYFLKNYVAGPFRRGQEETRKLELRQLEK